MGKVIRGVVIGMVLLAAPYLKAAYLEQQITGFGSSEISKIDYDDSHTSYTKNASSLYLNSSFSKVEDEGNKIAAITLNSTVSMPAWLVQDLQLTLTPSTNTPASGAFKIVLSSGSENGFTFLGNWANYSISGSGRVYDLDYSGSGDEEEDSSNGVAISSVKTISVYTYTKLANFTLDNLEATPEPGICILTGMGLLALVLWRGKNRRMAGLI
jgi:hypothetical protein